MRFKNLLKFLKLFIFNEEFRKDFLNKELRNNFLGIELRKLYKEQLNKEKRVQMYLDVLNHYEIPEDVHVSNECYNRMKTWEGTELPEKLKIVFPK